MGEETPEPRLKKAHSVKVPSQYKEGAKMLRQIVEEGKSLKSLTYSNKHIRLGSMVKLLNLVQVHEVQLEEVIKQTKIFEKENHLNPWLGRILISQLLFGRQELNGDSKPVECVRGYAAALKEALAGSDAKPKEHKEIKYRGE